VQYGGNYKPLIEVVKVEEDPGEKGDGEGDGDDEVKDKEEGQENGEEVKAEAGTPGEMVEDVPEKFEEQPVHQEQLQESTPRANPISRIEDAEMADVPSSAPGHEAGEAKTGQVAATVGDTDRDSGEAE